MVFDRAPGRTEEVLHPGGVHDAIAERINNDFEPDVLVQKQKFRHGCDDIPIEHQPKTQRNRNVVHFGEGVVHYSGTAEVVHLRFESQLHREIEGTQRRQSSAQRVASAVDIKVVLFARAFSLVESARYVGHHFEDPGPHTVVALSKPRVNFSIMVILAHHARPSGSFLDLLFEHVIQQLSFGGSLPALESPIGRIGQGLALGRVRFLHAGPVEPQIHFRILKTGGATKCDHHLESRVVAVAGVSFDRDEAVGVIGLCVVHVDQRKAVFRREINVIRGAHIITEITRKHLVF